MLPFSGERLAWAAGARVLSAGKVRSFTAVGTDSRKLERGALFVALRGARSAGELFFGEALARGAGALLGRQFNAAVRRLAARRGTWLLQVADGLPALQSLARDQRRLFDGPVLVISGSNGKSGTKDLLAHLLSAASPGLATQGNLNNHVGLPLTLLRSEKGQRWMVLEAGMNHFGELLSLARLSRPTHALLLNVGDAHLGHFKDRQAVGRAKEELLTGMGSSGVAILNAEDPIVCAMGSRFSGRKLWFGRGTVHGVELSQVQDRGAQGMKAVARWRCPGKKTVSFRVQMSQGGRSRQVQAAAGLTAALALGLPPKTLSRALAAWRPQGKMREEVRRSGSLNLVLDAYNASPQSMRAGLEFLASSSPRGQRAAALGEMLELGKHSARLHWQAGRDARELGVGVLAAVGKHAKELCRGFGGDSAAFGSGEQAQAAAWLKARLKPGQWLLIKGSRGSAMEKMLPALEAA